MCNVLKISNLCFFYLNFIKNKKKELYFKIKCIFANHLFSFLFNRLYKNRRVNRVSIKNFVEKIDMIYYKSFFQRFCILFLTFSLFPFYVVSQTYLTPSTGNTSITTCSGVLQDPGGSGNYSNNSNGYIVIHSPLTSCQVHLEGSYQTENNFDYIKVYDGEGISGTPVLDLSGNGFLDITSTSGTLTVRFTSDGSVTRPGYEFEISCIGGCACGGSPFDLIVNATSDGIVVSWPEAIDTSVTSYFIEYGLTGFVPGSGTIIPVNDTSYTLLGLNANVVYDIYVYLDCGNDGQITDETPASISFCVPEVNSCIDFSDLNNSNITCTYGFFSNPYMSVGVIDHGETDRDSRHTIHRIQALDPRTDFGLQVIPPCELYSVRLGNWDTGAEAESISYDFFVDTNVADLLLLKYAAVLEDPAHTPSEQPRFTFEILNASGQLVDSVCGSADFIANPALGWNISDDGDVLWKDWTNVGVDVAPYHGQTIRVRMTTYDCDQTGHYGYAYFTLNCKKKTIVTETCGEILSNTYTAPAGFEYRWYYQDEPDSTLSNLQSITVTFTEEERMLCCWCSFVGNSYCGFELKTSLTSRYPLASFTPERDSCSLIYNFHNQSTVSPDGLTPSESGEPCEKAYWDFGDGTTSTDYNPVHEFSEPGTYNVRLISTISYDNCQDTAYQTVHIVDHSPAISGESSTCLGEPITLTASGGESYVWLNGTQVLGQDTSITITSHTSTTYTLQSTAADGCVIEVEHELIVHDTNLIHIYDTICQGEHYSRYGFSIPEQETAGAVNQIHQLQNRFGCDSVVTLHLTVNPLNTRWDTLYLMDSWLPYEFPAADTLFDENTSAQSSFVWYAPAVEGCDTVVMQTVIVFSDMTAETHGTINTDCEGRNCFYDGPSIMINEVMLAPVEYDGSIVGETSGMTRAGEWIELYNPHKCDPVDISCYFLGNNAPDTEDYGGGFALPQGTVVPPQGFCVVRGVRAPAVPSSRLVENGGNVVEVVVDERYCYGQGSRLWFPNAGGWFAFYDANGVPQDAITWCNTNNSCLTCAPCLPETECGFSGALASYNEIPSERKSYITSLNPQNYEGLSIRRVPDGGSWNNTPAPPTYGDCNDDCVEPAESTCNAIAVVTVNGGVPPFSYQWDDSFNQTNDTAFALCEGVYTVTVTDAIGNTATSSVTIVDFVPDVTHDDFVFCLSDSIAVLQQGIPAGGVYQGVNMSNDTLVFDPDVSQYQLTYTYTDSNGCVASTDFQVTVNDNFAERELEICSDDLPLNWHGVSLNQPGDYTVTVPNNLGCDSVITLHLSVVDSYLQIHSLTEDFCENQQADLMVETSMLDYEWSTGETSQIITVLEPGTYSVTATQGACSVTATIFIKKCEYELFLPNTITPTGGDGLNDYFFIPEITRNEMDKFEISIYNRWGQLVYRSTDKNFKWNGEYHGKIQTQSIFHYVIYYTNNDGRPYFYKGTLTVM